LSSMSRGIFQCWALVPDNEEAVTPGEVVVICWLCTIRKAVVYIETVTSSVAWLRFADKVTGPPLEGFG
jgi:hypothetical protein